MDTVRVRRGAAVACLCCAFASPVVWAVDAATTAPVQTVSSQDLEELPVGRGSLTGELIVVTGSRIKRATGVDTPTPTTVVDSESIDLSGNINLGDYLNDLPQLRSTFSLQNSGRFIGTTGLNLLDLRGLGDARTLTLVDGRRHVGAVNGSSAVDINAIPKTLVERVEVITGGASAIYGADAVTGVVNFVMKDDFEGLQVEGYGSQPNDDGGDSYDASVTWGKNFSDGAGNLTLFYGYSKTNQIEGVDRSWISDEWGAVPNPADTGADDRIPDLIYRTGARNNIISKNGLIWGEHPVENVFGIPIQAVLGLAVPGGPYTFDAAGALVPFNPGQTFTDANGFDSTTSVGGDGLAFADFTQMVPDIERNNLYGRGSFEVNEHVRVTGEAKYVRTESSSYTQPTFDFFGDLIVTPDNPFMPTDLVNVLAAEGLDFVSLNRFNNDLGFRGEDIERETYRYVLAFDGLIGGSWTYNSSFVYGRYEGQLDAINNRNNTKFAFAVDAIANPNGGAPICRDPDARADGCVPLNLFGVGFSSPAAIDYIMEEGSQYDEKLEQLVFSTYASGNVIDLWAGPLQAVVGVEARKEKSKVSYADIIKSGETFFNALADGDGDYDVVEGFVEVSIPLLANVPWAKELRLDAAERWSDYSTIGATDTWKVGAEWLPVDDLRLRTTRSKAVRSPNISELFDPLGQNFFEVTDPCSETEIPLANDPALRQTNCDALGRPAGFQSVADNATLPGFSGGNPDLAEEKADTWTFGAVIAPRWVPNLTLTADYWKIEIEGAISAVAEQDILDKCVDGPSTSNIFCPLIERSPTGAPDEFEITSITQTSLNIARLEASGVDIELNYVWDLGETFDGDWGTLNLGVIGSHVYNYEDFDFEDEPETQDDERGEIGNPIDNAVSTVTYDRGPVTVSWRMEYVDSMRLIENEDPRERESPYEADEVFYHDLQLRYLFDEMLGGGLALYGGVTNLTDEDPPEYLTGIGEGSAIYDVFGRTFYLGFRYTAGGG